MAELDPPPQLDTWRYFTWFTVRGLTYLRAHYGRRFIGAFASLWADALSEGASQAVFAVMPGHPQQAQDSLRQVGQDRGLNRFRGETNANWLARVRNAWADYGQGGTPQQVIQVLNQWGKAGWPATWVPLTLSALVESTNPTVTTFTVTIPFGNISPPWPPWIVGGPYTVGQIGLFVGVALSTDIPTLLYIVRKWKPSRSRGFIKAYYTATDSVTFTV